MLSFGSSPRRWVIVLGLVGLAMTAWLTQSTPLANESNRSPKFQVDFENFPLSFSLLDPTQKNWVLDNQIEPSAVELIGDGQFLLIADDKTPSLRVVETNSGRIVNQLASPSLPKPNPFGPKWEGSTQDAQGTYYLCGSHSGVTPEERREREVLISFKLTLDGNAPPQIDESTVKRWSLIDSLIESLQYEKLTPDQINQRKIEGLAFRIGTDSNNKPQRQLLFGLREPLDKARIYAANLDEAVDGKLKLVKLLDFDPGQNEGLPFTIATMECSQKLGGLLISGSTEDLNNVYHGNALWFVPNDALTPNSQYQPRPILLFEAAMKAEGFCELPGLGDAPSRWIVVYDNDVKKTKIPSRFQTLRIVEKAKQ